MICYYLNLDRAAERRAHMERLGNSLGIELVRIAAVDGVALTDEDMRRVCPAPGRVHALSRLEVACFLGHREAWRRIAESGQAYGAVFEDDVLVSPDAARWLARDEWIGDGRDIIKIETYRRPVLLVPPASDAGDGRQLWRKAGDSLGAAGYIVSRNGALELLRLSQVIADPIDYFLFVAGHEAMSSLGVWQLVPALCVQQVRWPEQVLPGAAGASQVAGLRGSASAIGLAKLRNEVRRPFSRGLDLVRLGLKAMASGGRYRKIGFR